MSGGPSLPLIHPIYSPVHQAVMYFTGSPPHQFQLGDQSMQAPSHFQPPPNIPSGTFMLNPQPAYFAQQGQMFAPTQWLPLESSFESIGPGQSPGTEAEEELPPGIMLVSPDIINHTHYGYHPINWQAAESETQIPPSQENFLPPSHHNQLPRESASSRRRKQVKHREQHKLDTRDEASQYDQVDFLPQITPDLDESSAMEMESLEEGLKSFHEEETPGENMNNMEALQNVNIQPSADLLDPEAVPDLPEMIVEGQFDDAEEDLDLPQSSDERQILLEVLPHTQSSLETNLENNDQLTSPNPTPPPRPSPKHRNRKKTREHAICAFCKLNKAASDLYSSHKQANALGETVCPVLRKHVCEVCGKTGKDAHTEQFCPHSWRNKCNLKTGQQITFNAPGKSKPRKH